MTSNNDVLETSSNPVWDELHPRREKINKIMTAD